MIEESTYKRGCCVCGKGLFYETESRNLTCFYCKQPVSSNVTCIDGHFVCDSCHTSPANDLIEVFCISASSNNPLESAESLMNHPNVKMHGPEHHFLVPAVLLASYYNKPELLEERVSKIQEARRRAKAVLGGFCGSHGNCGAAVGVGIFTSLIKDNNPLATEAWKESNLMTARSFSKIAEQGGPRCCKRNSFLAIESAMHYLDGFTSQREMLSAPSATSTKSVRKRTVPILKTAPGELPLTLSPSQEGRGGEVVKKMLHPAYGAGCSIFEHYMLTTFLN